MINRNRLIDDIAQAFASVPYPKPEEIIDDRSDPQCDKIASILEELTWRDLNADNLMTINTLAFFTPQSLHYFLPGVMIASLEDYIGCDARVDDLVYGLTRAARAPRKESVDRYQPFESLPLLVTKEQARAIGDFLAFLEQGYPEDLCESDLAARRYWYALSK